MGQYFSFLLSFFKVSILLSSALNTGEGVCVCVCQLSSEHLSSRLRASDFVLMAERSTVLCVPSGHTYLSRKTGDSTPPLHTPRQYYTHTHDSHTLRYCGLKSLRGNTPCNRETMHTQTHTNVQPP